MRILIVGGGIAGLALARALERRGIAANVIERRPAPSAIGAGLYLPGNATRAAEQLGLLPELKRAAVPVRTQAILDGRGRQLSLTRTEPVWRDCGPCLALPRSAFQQLLLDGLQTTRLHYGKTLAGLAPTPEGCEAHLDDGSTQSYDLIVGADGIHSRVRQSVFSAGPAQYGGRICWRFIAPNTAGIDGWTVMLGNRQSILGLPVSPSDIYVYADIAVPESEIGRFSARSPLASLFAGFGAPVYPLLEAVPAATEIHFGRIEQVKIPAWTKGRVVLVGDAAHAASPSMAEGAGMAMEDALVLAEALSAGPDIETALSAYESRRRPRVEWVQAQCAARDWMRTLPGPARAAILRLFGNALYRRSYAPLMTPA